MRTMPRDKSVGIALLLAFLFGPLGLVYVSVAGAIVLGTLALALALLAPGASAFPVWVAAMVWAGIGATRRHDAFRTRVAPGRR